MAQIVLDRFKKTGLARRTRKQIDPPTQPILQKTLQPHERSERRRRIKLNQHIPITLVVALVACTRTKKPQITHSETMQLPFQFSQGVECFGPV